MTQYLLGQIEELQKIEDEQSEQQSARLRDEILETTKTAYGFDEKSCQRIDFFRSGMRETHDEAPRNRISSASESKSIAKLIMSESHQQLPDLMLDERVNQPTRKIKTTMNSNKMSPTTHSSNMYLSSRQQLLKFKQTLNTSSIFKKSGSNINKSFSQKSMKNSKQKQTSKLHQPLKLANAKALQFSQPNMENLLLLQPTAQKSNISRQNPLCLSQSTSVFSTNKGASALSLTKEKSANSNRKTEYRQQKVIINKIQKKLHQKLNV